MTAEKASALTPHQIMRKTAWVLQLEACAGDDEALKHTEALILASGVELSTSSTSATASADAVDAEVVEADP